MSIHSNRICIVDEMPSVGGSDSRVALLTAEDEKDDELTRLMKDCCPEWRLAPPCVGLSENLNQARPSIAGTKWQRT